MAAGRQNLSRKRYAIHSDEESNLSKYHYNQRTSGGGLDHWNTDRTTNSGARSHDHRRNGCIDDSINRYRSAHPYDGRLQGRSKEEVVYENGPRSGPAKKRKFSPIVWDGDDKQVKISSKNRILTTSSVFARGKLSDDEELQISPVESLVSNVSDGVGVSNSLSDSSLATSPEQHVEDDQKLEKEEGEYVEERNLSKSKWAFEDLPRKQTYVNNSSPESGEFKREGFEGSEDVSTLSAEDEQSENVDHKIPSGSSMDYSSSEDDNDVAEIPKCSGLDMMCRNVFEYERLSKISEGTYGVVYKARDKKTGEIVALKKVKMGKEREGFPVTSLREINILGSFQHPAIVEVKEVVMDDFDGVYMVMGYVDHELKGYMDSVKQPFSQSEVKSLMIQLLEGLSFLHDNWVIHRDLKTSNLLLNKNGKLKICDCGMSRQYGSPVKPYTPLVVTLWYRAPEVLLGMKQYSTAIDMWSVGCIMAELLTKKPLFDGNRELEQIDKIFRTLGTPNETIWPGFSKLPGVKCNLVKQPYNNLRKQFPVATFTGSPVLTEMGFDLLNKLLTYDPRKRITAEEALNHGWFREAPLPAERVRICK